MGRQIERQRKNRGNKERELDRQKNKRERGVIQWIRETKRVRERQRERKNE